MTNASQSRVACGQHAQSRNVNSNEKENSRLLPRDSLAKAFGKTLKEQREARGLSQEELAARCEISRTYPSLLERALRTPTLTTIVQFAEALSIPAPDLVALTLQKLPTSEPAKRETKHDAERAKPDEVMAILSSPNRSA